MNSIQNLDCPFVMAEIMAGDIDITPLDIINRLIKNNEDEILALMLNEYYQLTSSKFCKPIDDAIKQEYEDKQRI